MARSRSSPGPAGARASVCRFPLTPSRNARPRRRGRARPVHPPPSPQTHPCFMKTISVLLADDHTVVRQGLHSLLSAEPDITVVGEAANGRQALEMAQQLRPNIIVMDLAMPLLNGSEAARQIMSEGLPSKLLILSSYDDD